MYVNFTSRFTGMSFLPLWISEASFNDDTNNFWQLHIGSIGGGYRLGGFGGGYAGYLVTDFVVVLVVLWVAGGIVAVVLLLVVVVGGISDSLETTNEKWLN